MTKPDVDLAGHTYWEDVWERTGQHSVGQFSYFHHALARLFRRHASAAHRSARSAAPIPPGFLTSSSRECASAASTIRRRGSAAPAGARAARPVGEPDRGRHARPGGAADRRERSRLQPRARRTLPRSGRNPSADARSPARRRRAGHGRAQPARAVGIPRRAVWRPKCSPCTCCTRRRSSTQSIGRPASNRWSRRGTSGRSGR